MCLFKQSFWRVRCSAKLPSSSHPRGFPSLASQTDREHHPFTSSDFQPKAFWKISWKCSHWLIILQYIKIPLISAQGLLAVCALCQLNQSQTLVAFSYHGSQFDSSVMCLWVPTSKRCISLAYHCDTFLQFTESKTEDMTLGLKKLLLQRDTSFVQF